jgi:uncharacterized repeat protein (TIGR03803 family)
MTRTRQYRTWISAIYSNGASSALALGLVLALAQGATSAAQAQTYSVLYSFKSAPDGAGPQGDLIRDAKGSLYGTTASGGTGSGVVFKVDTLGNEKVLYRFTGGADGGSPRAGLLQGPAGSFYGTTYSGGAFGQGVVFKFKGSTETVLHSFGGADGSHPTAGLIHDKAGNLYGTTFYGGTAACSCGTVFKLDTTGTETVLYSFTGGGDGKFPEGRLALDAADNLYGTTSEGGFVNCDNLTDGCGVIFKLNTSGTETVLYSFGGTDGGEPRAGLIRDSAGNLYGTGFSAGDLSGGCAVNHGCGAVFRLGRTGVESTLYTFTDGSDGANPAAGLVRDSAGNLYGTAKLGGVGYGVVFKVGATGGETTLYSFSGNADGAGPVAGLVRDSAGNLYGTAAFGGNSSAGVVFKIAP